MLRDSSINFITYVNCMDIENIAEAYDSMGCEFEINDGFVTAVLFKEKED